MPDNGGMRITRVPLGEADPANAPGQGTGIFDDGSRQAALGTTVAATFDLTIAGLG